MENENRETACLDNQFADKVADKVREHVAESYTHLARVLEEIKNSQKIVEDSYVQLKEEFSLLGNYVDDIRGMIPDNFRDEFYQMKNKVNTLQSVSSKKAIKTRIVFTALAAIIITLLIVFMLLPWFHNHFLAEINYRSTDTIEWTKQLHEGQARDNGATRSIPMPKTDAERDTLINQQERAIKARK